MTDRVHTGESDADHLPRAVGTYIIQGDKIARHTTRFRWITK